MSEVISTERLLHSSCVAIYFCYPTVLPPFSLSIKISKRLHEIVGMFFFIQKDSSILLTKRSRHLTSSVTVASSPNNWFWVPMATWLMQVIVLSAGSAQNTSWAFVPMVNNKFLQQFISGVVSFSTKWEPMLCSFVYYLVPPNIFYA